MREAVHEALHVQRINEAHGAEPEETHPTEPQQGSAKEREKDYGGFKPAPYSVRTAREFRRPALLVRRVRLIEPAQMRPPEAALLGAGDVVRRIRYGMMEPVVRNPACGVAGAVEDRPEDQHLLDELVGLERVVRQHAVEADCRAQAAKCDEENRQTEDFQAGERVKNQTNDR